MEISEKHHGEIKERFAQDPFGDQTMKYRRNVLAFSWVCILVEIFGVRLKDMPYVAVESIGEPSIVKGVLSVVMLYQFLVFLCYCWVDFRRWYLYPDLLVAGDYFSKYWNLHNVIKALGPDFLAIQNHQLRRDLGQFWENAIRSVEQMELDLRRIHRRYKVVSNSQWFRIGVFDVGIPLLLGSLAIFLLHEYPVSFLNAISRSVFNSN